MKIPEEQKRRKENARKRSLPGAVDRSRRTETLVAEVRKERFAKDKAEAEKQVLMTAAEAR